jgi:hypothetical protein
MFLNDQNINAKPKYNFMSCIQVKSDILAKILIPRGGGIITSEILHLRSFARKCRSSQNFYATLSVLGNTT